MEWKNWICPLLKKEFAPSLSSSIFCSRSEICVEWYFHFVFGRGQLTISVILVTQPVVRWVDEVVVARWTRMKNTPLWNRGLIPPRLWSIVIWNFSRFEKRVDESECALSLLSSPLSLSVRGTRGSLEGNGYSAALKELTRGVPFDRMRWSARAPCHPWLWWLFLFFKSWMEDFWGIFDFQSHVSIHLCGEIGKERIEERIDQPIFSTCANAWRSNELR